MKLDPPAKVDECKAMVFQFIKPVSTMSEMKSVFLIYVFNQAFTQVILSN